MIVRKRTLMFSLVRKKDLASLKDLPGLPSGWLSPVSFRFVHHHSGFLSGFS
jgi:hypothetical protein